MGDNNVESHEVQVQTIGVEVTGKVKSPKKYPLLISITQVSLQGEL